MAGLTKAQRAEKKLAETVMVKVPETPTSIDQIPVVSRGTVKKVLDADAYADEVLARRKEFNGLESNLAFEGEHPGWKRRWVNEENVPGRLEEGFRFVLRDEVSMSDSLRYGNEDTGDRVSKHAGFRAGIAFKAFLMEIPQRVADVLDKEKSHDQIARYEHSIRAGAAGNVQGARVGAKDGLPEIKLS
jgi:hypothetical protein